ncbi:hypothetical protein RDWZM_001450 [Blomia tropicalis]|uniref:G-protein coupled receptors family 1 profile domain-containing protein n=1 Tax=Blomia tropicalis TaxID=40697 RepID=A0A9Q0MG16_BLOTA|nr:hypothetical protein RDWZM_001450 [Blomia tropicalis]
MANMQSIETPINIPQWSTNIGQMTSTYQIDPLSLFDETDPAPTVQWPSLNDIDDVGGDTSIFPESFRNTFLIFCYSLIVILSLFGNGLLIPVMLSKNSTRTLTNMLIVNLAVADLLLTLFNIPVNIVRFVSRDWIFGSFICQLTPFIQSLSAHCSSITIMMIAYERYQRLLGVNPFVSLWYWMKRTIVMIIGCRSCHRSSSNTILATNSSEHQQIMGNNNPNGIGINQSNNQWPSILTIQIMAIWLVSGALSIPHSLIYQVRNQGFLFFDRPMERCTIVWPSETFRLAVVITTPLTQYLLPIGLTALFYTRIGYFLWRKNEPVGTVSEGRRASLVRRKRKRVKMLVWVVAVFALCWLPLHLYVTLSDLGLLQKGVNFGLFFTVHWFAMSSVCWNPYIYCWLNETFRNRTIEYLSVFSPIKNCIQRMMSPFNCCVPKVTSNTTTTIVGNDNSKGHCIENGNNRSIEIVIEKSCDDMRSTNNTKVATFSNDIELKELSTCVENSDC